MQALLNKLIVQVRRIHLSQETIIEYRIKTQELLVNRQ